jgi:hypothetical protein
VSCSSFDPNETLTFFRLRRDNLQAYPVLSLLHEIAFARRKKTTRIMLYPRAWRDSIRVAKALRDYREYAPPHRDR